MGKLVWLSVLAVALAALVGERLITLRKVTLAFRELTQNHLPNCQLIKGLEYGSEDVTILENGLALVSTGLKFPGLPSNPDIPGNIQLIDLRVGVNPVVLPIKGSFDTASFNPHGISVFTDEKDGSRYLFVVNHPHGGSQIEIFRFDEDEYTLLHIRTVKHELLQSVNDIVAVGVDSFYATNDYYFTNHILRTLEPLMSLTWCNVVYYSPNEVRSVSEGYPSANGINISPDKRYLYVSDILRHRIGVLEIQKDHSLTHIKDVEVGSIPDNIEVDPETGDLWIGCHPNGLKFVLCNPNDPPGSEVIRIQNIHSEKPVVTVVYEDDGSVLVGSSAASPYKGKLLIGTVYHKALCCDLQ
ncbi:serum paraoxonase/arylesterase 2-like [Astyanax mexicanus]|uniref:Paraoxonase n=2 Tax=Astyanax mexicanus TaxID=7994 RepID=A0A3B1IMJ3_ASTMX|nr:serum paraoxonase/arylesterase 2-like [Astyanax mexicanus]